MNGNVVGIDIGKKTLTAVRLKSDGRKQRRNFSTTTRGRNALLDWLADETVALEAGNQAFRIARSIVADTECTVVVLNPGDLATIYNSLKKTDKEDALKLARLVQRIPRDELPEVPLPDEAEEDARRLCSEQAFWTAQCTKVKNRLHSLCLQAGLTECRKSDLALPARRTATAASLPERYGAEFRRLDRELTAMQENLSEIMVEIRQELRNDSDYAMLVMSMPGIGPVTALALKAYIGDCSRFSRAAQVSNYVGLVPRVDISGQTARYGGVGKRGCALVRRAIVQGAWSMVQSPYAGPLANTYLRIASRAGKQKAIVAVARKMLETLYAMLRTGSLYESMPAAVLEQKMRTYSLAA